MNKKKITIFFTGGTISMKIDPITHSVVPALTPKDILDSVGSGIDDFAELNIVNFCHVAGPQMTCKLQFSLAESIINELNKSDVDGVIVTHGTDTLEETAYFLDLATNFDKPIVITGAMRNISELGFDGPSNLAASLITATSEESKGRGVLVVMNNEINAAAEVIKMNTISLDTFKSPAFGPLGIIDNNKAIYYRSVTKKKQYIGLTSVDPDVRVLKTYADMVGELIDYCVDVLKIDGLVIEAMGRGNVTISIALSIEKAIKKGVPVVICSRCPMGRVLDTYGYEGGGRHLRNMGTILGGDLLGHKARIKLMLALGKTKDMNEIKEIFESGLYE